MEIKIKRPATFVTGLRLYKVYDLPLNSERACSHPFGSFDADHVYTDGVAAGLQFILLAGGDLVDHELA